MSQLTPHDQVPPLEPDPLLQFFAEPEPEPVVVSAAPADVSSEPVVNAEVPAPPQPAPPVAEPDPELLRRLERTERMLEKAQIELSTMKSDLATLVSTIDDIRKRQSRPVERPAPIPSPAPAGLSKLAAVAATAAGVILVVVVWGMWSLASYEMPTQALAETQAAPQPVEEPQPVADTPAAAPIEIQNASAEIQNASAVTALDPPRESPAAQPTRSERDRSEANDQERRTAVTGYVGTLSIDASPGGEVFLDRKSVGRTPVRLENLRAGSHLVWIERDGFRRWTRVVPVAANRVSRVSAELDPVR